MNRRRSFILPGAPVLALSWVAFHRCGRSIWGPWLQTATGGKTVTSVLKETTAKGRGLSKDEWEWIETITLVALKQERIVEVWGRGGDGRLERVREFPFQGYSGRLGPKLREGDGQIPEGIYRIEYLNPNSSYHLSVKIDYPNEFDREKGRSDGRDHLGYDIFFHGKSVTIGCIPIGDDAIEELFTIVAQVGIGNVEVIIAPWDFREREDAPAIDAISWEEELYRRIRDAMQPYAVRSEGALD